MRRLFVALALALALVAGSAGYGYHRDAAAITITLGLSPQRQCDLARPLVRLPAPPTPLECYRSDHAVSWGFTEYTDERRVEATRTVVYLIDGASTQAVAELIAHEWAHVYVSAVWRGNGSTDDDWVAGHEPYVDHFARCVATRWAPC
jgi:hypothetical protein